MDKLIGKTRSIRKFNKFSVLKSAVNLSCEKLDIVFIEEDVHTVFNNFLNTYWRIFNSNFLLQKVYSTHNNKPWITTGIKMSCQQKREIYLISRDSNNSKLKAHYKSYCLVLSKVFNGAKPLYYNNKISKSNNRMKTAWDIIKMETCKNQLINIDLN